MFLRHNHNVPSFGILAIVLSLMSGPCIAADEGPCGRDGSRQQSPAQLQLEQQLEEITARITDTRKKVRDKTGLVEVAPDVVRRLITQFQEQREQLELDKAGATGRQQALEEAIAKFSKQLQERVESDEVSKQIANIVAVRQTIVQRLKQQNAAGAASQSEVENAEANLASARADLAVARQKALNSVSAEAMDIWNRQLLELSVRGNERLARLSFLGKRLDDLSAALPDLDKLDQLHDQLEQTRATAARSAGEPGFQIDQDRPKR